MRIDAGSDAHHLIVAVQRGTYSATMSFASVEAVLADLIAAGLIAGDGTGYRLTGEGGRALLTITLKGSFSTD